MKKITPEQAGKILGVSRNTLTYQIRTGKGVLSQLGFYCEPVPGNKNGAYVIYEHTLNDFIKNKGWTK